MQLLVVFLVMSSTGAWLAGRVARYTRDNPCLHSCRTALYVCLLFWGGMVFGKVLLVHQSGHVGDAAGHETRARVVADCLWAGEWQEVVPLLGFGNRLYRLALGVFYAITSAPPETIVVLNGALALSGLLGLLNTLSQATQARAIPNWLAVLTCALPSALFWTTTNLKEGIMLWASCGMLRLALLGYDHVAPSQVSFPVIQTLAALLIRPHYALVWLFASCSGVIIRRKAFEMVPVFLLGAGIAYWVLAVMAPATVAAVRDLSAGEALEEQYQTRRDSYLRRNETGREGGGSTIVYSGGGPVPVLSGLAIVFLRPYPTEVDDIASTLAGIEVWGLSIILGLTWLSCRHRVCLLGTSLGICGVISILLMGLLFSYCYNLGLAARQRLQVYPSILAMIALPVLSRQQPVKAADRDSGQGAGGGSDEMRGLPNRGTPHAVGLVRRAPVRRTSAREGTQAPPAGGHSQTRPPTKPVPLTRRATKRDRLVSPNGSETA